MPRVTPGLSYCQLFPERSTVHFSDQAQCVKSHFVQSTNVATGVAGILGVMNIPLVLLIAIARVTTCLSATEVLQSTNSYLTTADKIRFKQILEPGFKSNDISLVYYAVRGYTLLGETLPKKPDICDYLAKTTKNDNNITTEKAYYIARIWKTIKTCQDNPTPTLSKVFINTIEKDTSGLLELYYAVSGLTTLSEKLSRDRVDKVIKAIKTTLRKDDNLWNLGYTFHIASALGADGTFAYERIEDAIIQADEVDGHYLQFEGGLSVTSFLVNGIYELSKTLDKKTTLTAQQTVKLANYFLSRRSVQTLRGVTNLLSALTTIANYNFEKPVCVTLANEGISISVQQPLVTVKVCDILGKPLPDVSNVIANSATRVEDDTVVLSKQNFQASPADKTLFTINFMGLKPERGFYKISVTAGSMTNTVTVKVLSEVTVEYLEIGTGDADQTTQSKLTRVAYPQKLAHKIEADSQQKLVMRFLLRDGVSKKPIRAHQTFVRLSSASEPNSNKQTNEILFVAEPDASHVYKFDMPVGSLAMNFDHQSGDYNVELIVGDAVLINPFQWTVATVNLKFPEATATERANKIVSSNRKSSIYATKPEIKHMFREPEKRPPAFVSNLFTGLCLAPVLLLLILWAKLGVNISNFPLSLSAVTFHLGLGSIFVLFGIFWLKLNMFVTLRYLLGLGIVTFLAGNKMLSRIAHKHKSR